MDLEYGGIKTDNIKQDTTSFELLFSENAPSLPQHGNFTLSDGFSGASDQYITLKFGYGGAYYQPLMNTKRLIAAQAYNGKAKYVLDTSWFYDSLHPGDSVKICGTFLGLNFHNSYADCKSACSAVQDLRSGSSRAIGETPAGSESKD